LKIARWISIIGHPFVTILFLIAVETFRRTSPQQSWLAIVAAAIVVVLPLFWFMRRQVRRGRWKDVDASERSERPAFYTAAIIVTAILAIWLVAMPSTRTLARGAIGVLLLLIIGRACNAFLKTSLHVAFATFVAVNLFYVDLRLGIAAGTFVPLLAWARLVITRHTIVEVIAGVVLGGAIALGVRLL
jgi:membrane-associated phospholipid phosphatase